MIRKAFRKYRFWLILALLFASQVAIVGAFFMAIRVDLDAAQRVLIDQVLTQRAPLVALLALLLLTAQALALKAIIDRHLAPMARLAEEVVLLISNPGHRIVPEGAREVRDLATKLNALACVHHELRDSVEGRVNAANDALVEEKNRLAALMSELPQSVLVCNIEGTILLYNTRARQLFETERSDTAQGAAVGLGRSLFGILERGLVVHALEQIQYHLQHPRADVRPVSGFVTTLPEGQVVRAQMAPVLDGAGTLHGFVLTLDDITRHVEADNRLDALQQLLTQDVRATLAHIRSTAETMRAIPRMDEATVQQVLDVIEKDAQHLTSRIDEAEHQNTDEAGNQWHLEEMRARDLLALLQRRIGIATLAEGALDTIDNTLWLKVDSYTLTMAIAHLEHHLQQEQGVTALHLGLTWEGRLAHLELSWNGSALSLESLRSWEAEPLHPDDGNARITLSSAISGRGGSATYRFDAGQGISHYRVPLRVAKSRAPFELMPKQPGRPEFYDFDLFHQAGQDASLDQRALMQLSYTVFDTETTGLNPSGGDEIISIGALRIVNGRLLTQEGFDRLVHPGMYVNPESTSIHGIDNAMLKGRPGIEKVLPQFHRFADNTVLIAHNAAFDMKFLQMKEERTGIRFQQPVLDTLLLSRVIHPHQKDHSLDALARRFGVAVVGRHTALGDTLVTGEVFLKMLPLLAEKGILTLRQAREAAQETDYARIRY